MSVNGVTGASNAYSTYATNTKGTETKTDSKAETSKETTSAESTGVVYEPSKETTSTKKYKPDTNMIAKMKLIPVQELIKDKKLLLIDDSIVRGTQLGETTEFLYESGAKEVHVRPACPPIMFGCKYLNFSRSSSELDLITRRVIQKLEVMKY